MNRRANTISPQENELKNDKMQRVLAIVEELAKILSPVEVSLTEERTFSLTAKNGTTIIIDPNLWIYRLYPKQSNIDSYSSNLTSLWKDNEHTDVANIVGLVTRKKW